MVEAASRWAALVVSVLFTLIMVEGAIRIFHHQARRTNQRFLEPDLRLGWRPTPNYRADYFVEDESGHRRHVRYSTDDRGFRVTGASAGGPRLLFIGDSFTQAVNVDGYLTYPALLAKALDANVWSYGGGGYGTLQELMAAEDVIESINPDLVVLQFCSNDFINNVHELEVRSYLNNNGLARPYLDADSDTVRYLTPRSVAMGTQPEPLSKSLLFGAAMKRAWRAWHDSVEIQIAHGSHSAAFDSAVVLTSKLLNRFRRMVGDAQMAVFSCDSGRTDILTLPSEYRAFSRRAEETLEVITKESSIDFIQGPADVVAAHHARGVPVKDADGAHWNEAGHDLVARSLVEPLRKRLRAVRD
jgi:lysophospholipase L1-like esterase